MNSTVSLYPVRGVDRTSAPVDKSSVGSSGLVANDT
jgi:hypothetical protein